MQKCKSKNLPVGQSNKLKYCVACDAENVKRLIYIIIYNIYTITCFRRIAHESGYTYPHTHFNVNARARHLTCTAVICFYYVVIIRFVFHVLMGNVLQCITIAAITLKF